MDFSDSARLLELVSRSFALCIPRLPAKVRSEVGNYYLLCRYLDSIEDSTLPQPEKKDSFQFFLRVLKTEDLNGLESLSQKILPFVPNPNDAKMISEFNPILQEFISFDSKSKKMARHWIAVMARGMHRFSYRKIRTFADLDRYCYYVAGTVGHFLTDIFAHKFGLTRFHDMAFLGRHFGLLLQKVNIIRDFSKDFSENRVFWPSQLFEKQGLGVEEVFEPQNRVKSQRILNSMVLDAQRHAKHCVQLINQIPEELTDLRVSCAIPLYMAIPTLEKCENNPAVFEKSTVIKLSRSETAEIISGIEKKYGLN